MTEFDPTVAAALDGLISVLGTEFPEVVSLLEQARTGERTETEVMVALMELMQANPDMERKFLEQASQLTSPLREEGITPTTPLHPLAFDSGVGLPQLNPLYVAALVERLQFDGDIPELRFGPAPLDALPAVPIRTSAHSLITIGQQLEQAGQEVRLELDAAHKLLQAQVEGGTALTPYEGQDASMILQGSAETDPEGYKRGSLPALRSASKPSGASLATLAPEDAKASVWKALSSTQGRRSAVTVILESVMRYLKDHGHDVEPRPFSRESVPVVVAEWTVGVTGSRNMTTDFAFVDTAAAVIARRLSVAASSQDRFWLEVRTVDDIANRQVGWQGQLIWRKKE